MLLKANILIDDEGHVRIADFGLLTIVDSEEIENESSHIDKEMRGTLRWMAPELFDSQAKKNPSTDIYAFGMTIYEVGSGLGAFFSGSRS